MRKVCGLLLFFVMLLVFTGCAYSDQAPTLYIQIGGQVLEQSGSVTSWEKMNVFTGSTEAFIADMVFPTQIEYDPIYAASETMEFSFDEEPKSMSLSYYSGKDVGNDIYGVQSKSIKADGKKWPLQEGANIYELNVCWENSISKRHARYCFYIEKTE